MHAPPDLSRLTAFEIDGVETISAEALVQRLRSNRRVVVLDVRDDTSAPAGIELGRIRGSRHIPLRQLVGRRAELAGLEEEEIVTVSQTGSRAKAAAIALSAAGFHAVRALEGGLARWARVGLPLG